MSDRNLASLPEVAFLLGRHPDTVRRKLANGDSRLTSAVVSESDERLQFSVPIICLRYHGEMVETILPQFYDRLEEYRTRRNVA